MFIVIIGKDCHHPIFRGNINTNEELDNIIKEINNYCPECKSVISNLTIVVDKDEYEKEKNQYGSFEGILNKPKEPRKKNNYFLSLKKNDYRIAIKRLKQFGGKNDKFLSRQKDEVISMLPEELIKYVKLIPIGIIDSYEINAFCAKPVDCSIPIILVHSLTTSFFYDFSCVFGLNCDVTTVEKELREGRRLIKGDDPKKPELYKIKKLIISSALGFLGSDLGIPDIKQVKDGDKIMLIGQLTRGLTQFIIAHEYGHAVLGHNEQLSEIKQTFGQKSVQFYTHSKQYEFDADIWAQDLLCGEYSKKPPTIYPVFLEAVPLIFMILADLIQYVKQNYDTNWVNENFNTELASIYSYNDYSNSTHPSNKERFINLYKYNHSKCTHKSRVLVGAVGYILFHLSDYFIWIKEELK